MGFDSWPRLSDAVPARLQGSTAPDKNGNVPRIHIQRGGDAWHVWQQAVEACGRYITFMDLDRVIVTTADAYYRKDDPIVLEWGSNIWSIEEKREMYTYGTGVVATSFDPLSGRTLEAFWPPRKDSGKGDQKKVPAQLVKLTTGEDDLTNIEKYDQYPMRGVLTESVLLKCARSIYLERSKQELQGKVRTLDLMAQTLGGELRDLFDSAIGDNVYIRPQGNLLDPLARLETTQARLDYLIDHGVPPYAAAITAHSFVQPALLDTQFYLKGMRVEGSAESGLDVDIDYCNRIVISAAPEMGATDQHEIDQAAEAAQREVSNWVKGIRAQPDPLNASAIRGVLRGS
jgi:hypothetical protein